MIRQMQMILSYMKLMKNLFLIKTKADEYCFTNRAIIHVDGESAMSKKRLLQRYDYSMYTVTEVFSKQQEQSTLMSKLSLQSAIPHYPSTFINAL